MLSCPIGQTKHRVPTSAKRCDSSSLESAGGGFIRERLDEYTLMVIGVLGLEMNVDYLELSE